MSLRLLQKQFGLESEVSAESKAAVQPNRGRGRGRGAGDQRAGDRGGGASQSGAGGAGQFGATQSAGRTAVLAPEVRGGFHGSDAMKAHIAATKQAATAAKSQKDKAQEWKDASEVAVQSGLGLRALEEKKQREEEERQAKREAARAKRLGEVGKKEAEDARAIEECEEQAWEDGEANERVKYEAALIVRIANRFGSSGVWTKIAEARSRGADIPLDAKRVYLLAHPDKCPLPEAADATAILNAQRPPEMTESRGGGSGAAGGGTKEAVAARVAARRAGGAAGTGGSGGARVDPEDGQELSFQELVAKYKGTYSQQELQEYWDRECTPVQTESAKLSPEEEERRRRMAARAARSAGGGAPKAAPAPSAPRSDAKEQRPAEASGDGKAKQEAEDALADAAGGEDAELLRECLRRAEAAGVDEDSLEEARERLAELCADAPPETPQQAAAGAGAGAGAVAEEALAAAVDALADAAGGEDVEALRQCIRDAEAAGVDRESLQEARERLAELREAQEAAEEVGNDALNEARHAQMGFADDFAEVANFGRGGPPPGAREGGGAAERQRAEDELADAAGGEDAELLRSCLARAEAAGVDPEALEEARERLAELTAEPSGKDAEAAAPANGTSRAAEAAPETPRGAVVGLARWLAAMGLTAHLNAVASWAEEQGAVSLDELAECSQDLAADLGLGAAESARLASEGAAAAEAAARPKEPAAAAAQAAAQAAAPEAQFAPPARPAAKAARAAAGPAAEPAAAPRAARPAPAAAAAAPAAAAAAAAPARAPAAAGRARPSPPAPEPAAAPRATPAAPARPPAGGERRVDPDSGEALTLRELHDAYAGKYSPAEIDEYWGSCAPAPAAVAAASRAPPQPAPAQPAPAQSAPAQAPPERRVDPETGEARTLAEMRAAYAGQYSPKEVEEYWESCKPATGGEAAGAAQATWGLQGSGKRSKW